MSLSCETTHNHVPMYCLFMNKWVSWERTCIVICVEEPHESLERRQKNNRITRLFGSCPYVTSPLLHPGRQWWAQEVSASQSKKCSYHPKYAGTTGLSPLSKRHAKLDGRQEKCHDRLAGKKSWCCKKNQKFFTNPALLQTYPNTSRAITNAEG